MKISSVITLLVVISYIVTGASVNCSPAPDPEPPVEVLEFEILQEVKEPPVILEPRPVKVPECSKRFVKYVWRLEYRFSRTRYNTCYTGYDKGDPGHGKYANQKYADRLHLRQRRIRYEHNTVALCPEDKRYHQELIQMPDGKWTHKWRVHIHGVHRSDIDESTDSGYFGVPRDRMKQGGRIDYLITQAGKYATKEQRVKNWKSLDRKVDFWEWTKYKLYSDGTKERVE